MNHSGFKRNSKEFFLIQSLIDLIYQEIGLLCDTDKICIEEVDTPLYDLLESGGLSWLQDNTLYELRKVNPLTILSDKTIIKEWLLDGPSFIYRVALTSQPKPDYNMYKPE